MPNKTIGLFIGKFQPFHNGHLFAIKDMLPKMDELIIAIGSSQYHNLKDQPFSAYERRQMIQGVLKGEGLKNISIIEVPDIHDNNLWIGHLKKYIKNFDVVFTNNVLVRKLFTEKGFKVEPIKVLPGVSGTVIRESIDAGRYDWKLLLSFSTARIIERHFKICT